MKDIFQKTKWLTHKPSNIKAPSYKIRTQELNTKDILILIIQYNTVTRA